MELDEAPLECKVCYDPLKEAIECPKCQCTVCKPCQIKSEGPKCMQCALVLPPQCLGTKLSSTLLRPWEEEQFWTREAALVGNTQLLLDWEVQTDALKAQQRFGFTPKLPPKPKLLVSGVSPMFPCPSETCRGFVAKGKCGTCKQSVCQDCREHHDGKCNADTLESLRAIEQDSRPCPICTVQIHKTEGCHHMFCTHCRTHWHWETRKVLKESSNGHYNATPVFNSSAALNARGAVSSSCGDPRYELRLPLALIRQTPWALALCNALTQERKQVVVALQSMYNTERLRTRHEEQLVQLRLKFLRSKLTLEQVKGKVWVAEKSFEKALRISHVLLLQLEQTALLRDSWEHKRWEHAETMVQLYNDVQAFCNLHCQAIAAELGGNCPSFLALTLDPKPLVDF